DWTALARRVESNGFSTLFMPDHFGDQFAPISALTAAAMVTDTLNVGALVFDNDYRHPVLLAKEAATMHVLTDGRTEFGIGAGWMRTDYDGAGMTYDRPGVRIDRMLEGLRVYKSFFAGETLKQSGEHYSIDGVEAIPAPAIEPRILIGGGGKRMLGIAAREADIVGVNPVMTAGEIGPEAINDMQEDAIDRKVAWVRDAAGDRFDDLELNLLVFGVSITDNPMGEAIQLSKLFNVSPEMLLASPHVWIGSAEQIAEDLYEYRERWGFSYFCVQGDAMDATAAIVNEVAGQ
ncbi:MAG: TIGR03621 family F420-dependent LLM class oxidoreductase, partial [Acidimicrobiales bacterium]